MTDLVTEQKRYYAERAPEYDDWYRGRGGFADRDRPGWDDELAELAQTIAGLPPLRTLDVASGTGFLTQHLPGEVTGLDQSAAMLELASARVPDAGFVQSDALRLPFREGTFDRVFTSHFYGHLEDPDAAARPGGPYGWEPLLYLTYSRVPQVAPLRAAKLLLAAGAALTLKR